jgi:hypothetical protein
MEIGWLALWLEHGFSTRLRFVKNIGAARESRPTSDISFFSLVSSYHRVTDDKDYFTMSTGQVVDACKVWAWVIASFLPSVSSRNCTGVNDATRNKMPFVKDAQPAISASCNPCNAAVVRIHTWTHC